MDLIGRVALVTGAAKRVGRAIALELARGGCDIAVHFNRSADEANVVVQEIRGIGRRAVAVQGEMNDATSWPRIVEHTVDGLGRLDILINNASAFATPTPDTIEAFDEHLWESMLRTNATAPVALCHHARPHLKKHRQGKIINLCDISVDRPYPSNLAYCASKAALVCATKALARALAPEIQVNGVSPGIAIFPDNYSSEKREQLVAKVPLKREGSPEEVAILVRNLVESSDYITGQIIAIDGGRSVV